MRDYAEGGGLPCQPRKMLISSYFFENGTLITPLILFYFDLRLKIKKVITSWNILQLNKIVQSAVNARREGDENANSSAVAETRRLLANSSYRYQIMYRSRHTATTYLSDERTHGAINTKSCKRLDIIKDQMYELEVAKAEIEHREPLIFGFFKLQYANLIMMELY